MNRRLELYGDYVSLISTFIILLVRKLRAVLNTPYRLLRKKISNI